MQFFGGTYLKSLYILPLHYHLPMYYIAFSKGLSCPALLYLLVHPQGQTTLPTSATQKEATAMSLPQLALAYGQVATSHDTL